MLRYNNNKYGSIRSDGIPTKNILRQSQQKKKYGKSQQMRNSRKINAKLKKLLEKLQGFKITWEIVEQLQEDCRFVKTKVSSQF